MSSTVYVVAPEPVQVAAASTSSPSSWIVTLASALRFSTNTGTDAGAGQAPCPQAVDHTPDKTVATTSPRRTA